MNTSTFDIRRANGRSTTSTGWLDSRHSFSFGPHYDRNNTNHGQLLVLNDDTVRGGAGFSTHPHRDMEIITWVLSGELEHRDSAGNFGRIVPGLAQRMSAGSGITHSERNAQPDVDVHFLQMWIVPDTTGIKPSYEQLDVTGALATGVLVPVVSGQGHAGAITLRQRDAVLWAGRLTAGTTVDVPTGRHVHLYVARGSGDLSVTSTDADADASTDNHSTQLFTGDAARLVEPTDHEFAAGREGAEVLMWVTA